MNWARGLFRIWLFGSALWICACAAFAALGAGLFEKSKTYEIEGRFKEKYEVRAPGNATAEEAVAYAEQRKRVDCTQEQTGPWCAFPLKLEMPAKPIDWRIVYLAIAIPAAALVLGGGLFWALAGFRLN